MTKLPLGYVALCVLVVGGALLVLLAAGGFGEYGIGLYGKIALALFIILAVGGGLALMIVILSGGRNGRDAVAGRPPARDTSLGRRDRPSEDIE